MIFFFPWLPKWNGPCFYIKLFFSTCPLQTPLGWFILQNLHTPKAAKNVGIWQLGTHSDRHSSWQFHTHTCVHHTSLLFNTKKKKKKKRSSLQSRNPQNSSLESLLRIYWTMQDNEEVVAKTIISDLIILGASGFTGKYVVKEALKFHNSLYYSKSHFLLWVVIQYLYSYIWFLYFVIIIISMLLS